MRVLQVLFLLFVGGLIFLVSKPRNEPRQAEEEMIPYEQVNRDTFRISFKIESDKDRPIADILWFQKAARIALDQRQPWFNVLEQRIQEDSVEGVIQLEPDPMKAEYDAHEILDLQLEEELQE